MAIKVVYDKLEDVPEVHRELFTENEGKFVMTGVENLLDHPTVAKLKTENGARRIDNKKLSDKLAAFAIFGDKTPEQIQAQLDRIPELEALSAGKVDEKKLDELVAGKLNTKLAPVQRDLDKALKALVERDATIAEFTQRETTRTIHDAIREAVGKAQGFSSSAMEDALLFGERHLTVSEDGKVITKDGVGVTPGVDAVVWLTEMKERKPHWWGSTAGGGASGGKGSGSSGDNPFAHDTWNLTKQGELVRVNPARAEQLAKAAGTRVGGPRPIKPK